MSSSVPNPRQLDTRYPPMSARALRQTIERRKDSERAPLFARGQRRLAVVYPSPYRAGMSSLGYQRILTLLRDADLSAERAFLPDDVGAWRRSGAPLITYETGTPLRDFSILAVSLAYEAELIGLFDLLQLSGIPVLRRDRGPHDPQILLGGPISMASPAFLADFVDACLLGEGEDVVVPGVASWFDAETRDGWLDAIEALPGGWVPERAGMRIPPTAKASDAHLPARSAWLAPEAELSNMFLIEGERGCHRMCTFCVMRRTTNGGMRLVSASNIMGYVPEEAEAVGLVGAAISDHPELVPLMASIIEAGKRVSLSSLRADQIARKPDIARLLRQSGTRTFTTASDGASERLRKQMKKTTTEAHLQACARQAGEHGFATFKLYMIIGAPGETDDDIDELVRFTKELAQQGKPARLAMGIAPFVAKRQTPLDGAPFAGMKTVERRMRTIKRGLGGIVDVRPVSARWAWLEHMLAQGGPEAGYALYRGWRQGGRFGNYRKAIERVNPSTFRPWAAFERPLVDPVVKRIRTEADRGTGAATPPSPSETPGPPAQGPQGST